VRTNAVSIPDVRVHRAGNVSVRRHKVELDDRESCDAVLPSRRHVLLSGRRFAARETCDRTIP
jgi:hypothetical protein